MYSVNINNSTTTYSVNTKDN